MGESALPTSVHRSSNRHWACFRPSSFEPMNTVLIVFLVVFIVVWLGRRFMQGMRVKPHILRSPKLGILNLKGESASQMVAADKAAVSGAFFTITESTDNPPHCEVLFLYCDFADEGQVVGATSGLRDIIRDSGAYVVVVASENSGERCSAAAKPTGYGQANLVLTLERRGDAFPSFHRQLFGEMAQGVSMPMAWVKLAPQIPGRDDPNCPAAIFACEAGQIAFGFTLSYET